MFLGAVGLEQAVKAGRISFSGRVRSDGLLLHAGGPVQALRSDSEPVDLLEQRSIDSLYDEVRREWVNIMLAPKEMLLVQASESVCLNGSYIGIIGTLSHLARCGLMAHLASPFVGPEFDGHLTLEVFNAGPRSLVLTNGMALAKVMVAEIEKHTASGYQAHYGELGRLASRYAIEFGDIRGEK